MYDPNPSRGCGTKKHDAFYLEGAVGAVGDLYAWTWCLGDGLDDSILLALPPRQESFINPAATITSGELYLADDVYVPAEYDHALYGRVLQSTRNIGIGDHVGSQNYSAYGFAKECGVYGPSRRVSRETAMRYAALMEELKRAGKSHCLPIMFTHSRVPVFVSEWERKMAYQIALLFGWYDGLWQADSHPEACWLVDDWGMYSRHDQYPGNRSQMIPILAVVEGIDREWSAHRHDRQWQEARAFYDTLAYEDQPIGLSWITHVTYVLPADGRFDPELLNVPGLQFLDLEKVK